MATKKMTTEEENEQRVAATETEMEESHVEPATETVEKPEASAAPETDVEAPAPESPQDAAGRATSELSSLSELADRHRVPSWQQAALCRFMGWAEGKLVSDAEYRDALENLKRRRLCGGRAR